MAFAIMIVAMLALAVPVAAVNDHDSGNEVMLGADPFGLRISAHSINR